MKKLAKILGLEDYIVDCKVVNEYMQFVETFNYGLVLVNDFETLGFIYRDEQES